MFYIEYSTRMGNFARPKPTREEADNFAKFINSLKGIRFIGIREDKETVEINTEQPKQITSEDFKIDWGRWE